MLFCRLCGKNCFINSAPGSRGVYVLAWVMSCHLSGWSCWHKGHQLPWDLQPYTRGHGPPGWPYFHKCCPQAFGWWGLWVTGCKVLLPAVPLVCSGVFLSLLSPWYFRSWCYSSLGRVDLVAAGRKCVLCVGRWDVSSAGAGALGASSWKAWGTLV